MNILLGLMLIFLEHPIIGVAVILFCRSKNDY